MARKLHSSKVLSAIFLAISGLQSPHSEAADYFSPRIAALGGAGHAGPMLNDAIYLNPSFIAFLPTYALGLNYLTYNGSNDNPTGRNYSVSIQDGQNQLFQAGLAYALREDGSFIHLGASKAFANRYGFGLSGKLFFQEGQTTGKELVFSSTGIIDDSIQTSLLIDNLLESKEAKARNMYRQITIGSKFNLDKIVLVYADPHYTPSLATGNFGWEAGLEFVLASDLFLRLGNFKNAMVPHIAQYGRGYGLGLGWVAPRLSIDYGLSRTLEPVLVTAHSFGATLYF